MLGNLVLYTAICLSYSVTAGAETQVVDPHICAADVGAIGNCTANDIKIADATRAVLDNSIKYCLPGDNSVPIDKIEVAYELNALQRYDPLLWVGLEGNDPREESGEDPPSQNCYVSSIPVEPANPIFADIDFDSCLDVNSTGATSVDYQPGPSVLCQDLNGDGEADFQAIVSWQQNTNQVCAAESFGLGSPSKCNYSLIPMGILFNPSLVTVIKTVVNDGGGTAVAGDWQMDVSLEYPEDVEPIALDPSIDNPSMTGFPGEDPSPCRSPVLSVRTTHRAWRAVDRTCGDFPRPAPPRPTGRSPKNR